MTLVRRNPFIERLRETPPSTMVRATIGGQNYSLTAGAHQLVADWDALVARLEEMEDVLGPLQVAARDALRKALRE